MHETICILGGTGFVGRHLVNRLSRDGHTLRVLTRRREHHRELLVIPTCDLIEADIHAQAVLEKQFRDCTVVINLVGILNERGNNGKGFHRVHVELAEKVTAAANTCGVRQLLHMSALNADANIAPSYYLRSKGLAEERVRTVANHDLAVTIFRPSVIFGNDDSFLNRFAALLRFAPVFPLACPTARFSPVFVGDVVEALARVVGRTQAADDRYDLCGPQQYSLEELVRMTAAYCGYPGLIWPLGNTLSKLQAWMMEFVPGKPFSRDNFLSLQIDSVCENNALPELGITPQKLATIAPRYLQSAHQRARYKAFRSEAGR